MTYMPHDDKSTHRQGLCSEGCEYCQIETMIAYERDAVVSRSRSSSGYVAACELLEAEADKLRAEFATAAATTPSFLLDDGEKMKMWRASYYRTAAAWLREQPYTEKLTNYGRKLELQRLINSLPPDVNKKLSLHDLKRIADNYNTEPCPNCYGGHQRPCQWCGDTGVVTIAPNENKISDVTVIDWMDAGDKLASAIDALVEQIGCWCNGWEIGVCPQCHCALETSEAAAGTWLKLRVPGTSTEG